MDKNDRPGFDRLAWALIAFALCYFGAHVVAAVIHAGGRPPAAVIREDAPRITEDDPRWDCRTMGNRVCGPDAPAPAPAADEWPDCGPACHDPQAARDVDDATAVTGLLCWAEDDPGNARWAGYRVVCADE